MAPESQTKTDARLEAEAALGEIKHVRTAIEDLLERESVKHYAADDELNEALNHIDAAAIDVARHGVGGEAVERGK